ncbi:MAG: hypothetical protein P9M15_02345 [Candidatus Electryoneaceae bacterium]|nr:hypothetical protein [Candidatus Electryoneaceae bacterium]
MTAVIFALSDRLESQNPVFTLWTPAFAGVTKYTEVIPISFQHEIAKNHFRPSSRRKRIQKRSISPFERWAHPVVATKRYA